MRTCARRRTVTRGAACALSALLVAGAALGRVDDQGAPDDWPGRCVAQAGIGNDGRCQAGGPDVVATNKGPVRGVSTATNRYYLGIPYAAPPTGALRWQPPQPASRWHGVHDATRFATHCPQPDTAFGRASNSSEDCLYLNVYRPKRGHRLPVMVWIHGGALWLAKARTTTRRAWSSRGWSS